MYIDIVARKKGDRLFLPRLVDPSTKGIPISKGRTCALKNNSSNPSNVSPFNNLLIYYFRRVRASSSLTLRLIAEILSPLR